ncbi:hypothetical protein BS47DRAFT_1350811 [Hydnum rufescens UP504]|uniref:Uncharacterized protein n=1 Tax=Hydnum rufescens UP504 TaxID=1448309 RepID=A0A9P6DRW0_9AGAM|nr:hypothetical protein BS47DRAFT_1350811 [Hydnum rufescens UP504]
MGTSASASGSTQRRRPEKPIKCMYFDPATGKLQLSRHDPVDPLCRFTHPCDGELWDKAATSYRRQQSERRYMSDRPDSRTSRPPADHFDHRKPDNGYPSRDSHRRRTPSPLPRRPSASDWDFDAPRTSSGWQPAATSSSTTKPTSPSRSDWTNGPGSSARTDSLPEKGNRGSVSHASAGPAAPTETPDRRGSTSKNSVELWFPKSKEFGSPVPSSPSAKTSGPTQVLSRKSTLDTTNVEKSDRMDVDPPLPPTPARTNDQQPLSSSPSGLDDKEASMISLVKLLGQMSELRTKINQRDEEIRVVNELVSRSSMTGFSHPRVARLQKDNEEDAATLLNLVSQAAEGLNPIMNLAQSSVVTKGIYQSRADLLALVEKLEADMRSLTQQQTASLPKPSESPTTTTSKKAETTRVFRERDLDAVRGEVVDAREAVAQWGDHFSDDMEARFGELTAKKNKSKSIQAARKRSATEEIQLEYEKQRAEDRDRIAQFMAEAHQQLKKVHKDNTDRIAKLENESQALLHALHAYHQSRNQSDVSGSAQQSRVHALFDEMAKSTLDTVRSEVELKLHAAIVQA